MTESARESIYEAISSIRLIDPHTHINPHNPASSTLADILGYHYYTELIHSAGMPREEIEEEGLHPRELVRRLVHGLPNIENTANYQWLISICRTFFGFEETRIDHSNWEDLYDAAESHMNSAEWPQMVLDQSNVEAVFLTNDFDDDLEGFDTTTYIPCLRTDDLVFHLAKTETRQRLEACSGIELDGSLQSLRGSLAQRFEHFVRAGARACAISIPPSFEPLPISDGRATTALDEVLRRGSSADESHRVALSRRVFWTLAELCDQYRLPFDLMIGVNRAVYSSGVHQGRDLYDSRVSLIQYRELFNTFRDVKFPVSVLASVTNQELVSYSWIFPNVITNGHWWYSNTPSFIARDAAARLEAVPRNNQIGYYSDAYKLEFVWPKFDMYRRILAGILADHFVGFCGWSEERAIELGRQVLRDNVDETFPPPEDLEATIQANETYVDDTVRIDSDDSFTTDEVIGVPGASTAALAAGAIGMVEVHDAEDLGEFDQAVEETVEMVDEYEGQPQTDVAEFDDDEQDAELDHLANEAPAELEETIDEVFDVEDSGEPLAEADLDDVEQESPTLLEETVDEVGDAEFLIPGDDRYDTVDEQALPELPTVLDLHDTVELDEEADVEDSDARDDKGFAADLEIEDSEVNAFAETVEIDSLPTDDEIEAVDVPDVELREPFADTVPDAAGIEAEADEDPLFIGDFMDDDDDANVLDEPVGEPAARSDEEIRMLRGEGSFTPDEDSLQLTRDPVTGEFMFPVEKAAASDQISFTESDEFAGITFEEVDESADVDDVEEVHEGQNGDAVDDDDDVFMELDDTVDLNEDDKRRD